MRHLGKVAAVLVVATVLAACHSPRYVKYTSVNGDFVCQVPWGWAAILDNAGTDFTNVTFTGPVEPMFYRGLPSFSIRWYKLNAPHRLPDGTYETYTGYEDFTRQMLTQVYGPDGKMWGGDDKELSEALARNEVFPAFQKIRISGWEGYYFVMFHDAPAASNAVYGVSGDGAGKRVVEERHAYAVVPMSGGFYVLIYPATRDGFEKYKPAFFRLINSFRILKEGPAGPLINVTGSRVSPPVGQMLENSSTH